MANRIPKSIPKYVSYMNDTLAYMQANSPAPFTNLNWQRLNWLNQELNDWEDFTNEANDLYEQYINKATCPPNVITELNTLVYDTQEYDSDNHLLDRIAATAPSLSFMADFTTFNIKHNSPIEKSKKPNTRHTATEKTVAFLLKSLGNGDVKFYCNTDDMAGRYAKLDGYDIEVLYAITAPGATEPTNISLLTSHDIFTKAIFVMHLGAANSGSKLSVAMRWFHKTDSPLNGPLSPMQILVIG